MNAPDESATSNGWQDLFSAVGRALLAFQLLEVTLTMCIEAAHQAARFALKSELKFVYKPRGKNLEGYISDYERCVGRTELVPRLRALNKQRIEVVHMLYVRSGLLTAIPERMKVAREAEEEALRLHDAVSDEYERLRTLANSHDPGSALVDLYVKQLMRENREKRELS